MFEYVNYGFGGIGFLSAIFMAGHTIATRTKLDGMVKKNECIKYRDDVNKQLRSLHKEINGVALGVARIEGHFDQADRKK